MIAGISESQQHIAGGGEMAGAVAEQPLHPAGGDESRVIVFLGLDREVGNPVAVEVADRGDSWTGSRRKIERGGGEADGGGKTAGAVAEQHGDLAIKGGPRRVGVR